MKLRAGSRPGMSCVVTLGDLTSELSSGEQLSLSCGTERHYGSQAVGPVSIQTVDPWR